VSSGFGQKHIGSALTPLLACVPPLAVVWWAIPEGLTLWRSVAIVTAWAGSGLLVSSLLLMIRTSRIAALLGGLESMYLWHHRTGLVAYLLLLCHPLGLALDEWFESPLHAWQILAPWEQAWSVWLGWGSLLLLMCGLTATFVLHLSYRRWRVFHATLALGVLLGLVHIYVLLGQIWPIMALAAIAALALGWRLIVSDLGVAAHPYQVNRVLPLATGIIEIVLEPCAGTMLITPGQFVLVRFDSGKHYRGCGEYHPFTVSGIEDNGSLRLAIKALGPCSSQIQSIEPGVLAHLQGPFGTFLTDSPKMPQLWVAGGIGITPFMALLRIQPPVQPVFLIYLYRSDSDAAFLDELNMLAEQNILFELRVVATGKAVPDFHHLLSGVADIQSREIYVCGPVAMVESLMPHLQHIPHQNIHVERFDFR
jgi:predicted ferric reductase